MDNRRSALMAGTALHAPQETFTTGPKTGRMGWEMVVERATCYWIISGPTRQDSLTRGETWLMTKFQPDGWPTIIPRVFAEDVRGVVGFLKLVFGARGDANWRPS